MSYIPTGELDAVLSALGEQLTALSAFAHIVVIGGSGLQAINVVARPTRDVDVVALEDEGVLVSADPLPEALIAAAALVARDFGLAHDWLNPGPTSLLDLGLPDGFVGRVVQRDYGPGLAVSFASRRDHVFFKFYAWADRGAPRDFSDLQHLAPSAEELRAAARWARTHNMPGPFDDAVERALADFDVDDDGRDV